jgi:hypothetical protein
MRIFVALVLLAAVLAALASQADGQLTVTSFIRKTVTLKKVRSVLVFPPHNSLIRLLVSSSSAPRPRE